MATYRKLQSGRHQFIVRRRGYPDVSKTFAKKTVGERWARDVETQMFKGEYEDDSHGKSVRFKTLTSRFRAEIIDPMDDRPSKYTDRSRLKILEDYFGRMFVDSITKKIVTDYALDRLKTCSSSTVARELTMIDTVLHRARDVWHMRLRASPVAEVKRKLRRSGDMGVEKVRDRRVTADEYAAIKSCKTRSDTLIRELVLVAIETAMRRSELADLQWGDLDLDKGLATIRRSKTDRKSETTGRTIPLTGEAISILKGIQRDEGSVFRMNAYSMTQAFVRLMKRLEIEDLRLHDLRHEAVSRLFEMGLDMREVALVSGHKDWRSLKRYTHPRAEDIVAKLRRNA